MATPNKPESRLLRDPSAEERGTRGQPQTEDPANTRIDVLNDDDFEQMLRTEFEHTALPTPPAIPGWHLCWLTTTSNYDSLQKRQRIGYVPVQQGELPNFQGQLGGAMGASGDPIRCNEMILAKLPEQRYQALMRHFHHNVPLESEQAVIERLKSIQNAGRDSAGNALVTDAEADGVTAMAEDVRRATAANPQFT